MNFTGLTLAECQSRYREYLEAESKVLAGESYKLNDGTELTRSSLPSIRSGLDYWENKCRELGDTNFSKIKVISVALK